MDLRAILFDVNGTLIDITTDEGAPALYTALSHLLVYQGILVPAEQVQTAYFAILHEQKHASAEPHPEFDAEVLWNTFLARHGTAQIRALPEAKRAALPVLLAEAHRALARRHLAAYPDARAMLEALRPHYRLGIVTDAQRAYAAPELEAAGLGGFFDVVVVSGAYGYRKPDPRLFAHALDALEVRPDQTLHVGNDMYCDVHGAQRAGVQAVFYPTEWGAKTHTGVTPDYQIACLADLPALVARIDTKSGKSGGSQPAG